MNPQHIAHRRCGDTAIAERDGLVSQGHGITDTAARCASDRVQRLAVVLDRLLGQHVSQMRGNIVRRQIAQPELQAAAQYRHRDFLRIRGREQEFYVGRRLFERFQQRIKRAGREHVDFVDQIDLKAAFAGCVLHVFQQLAGVFDFGSTGRVDLDQIDEAPGLN